MSFEYQIYLCLILATRLAYLRRDEPSGWKFAALLGASQILLVLLVFGFSAPTWLACLAALLFTVAGGCLERRRLLDGLRLISLFGLALAPTLSLAFHGQLTFTALAQAVGELLHGIGSVLFAANGGVVEGISLVLLALLLLANEVNIAMRFILKICGLVPVIKIDGATQETDVREFNAGRVIGILERWLMFIVIYMAGDWNALAFIIAAKVNRPGF